jgi:hypothetical protein
MRARPLLLAVGALLTASLSVGSTTAIAHAAPAGCNARADGIVLTCDQSVAAVGPRGSIGLVGDSVLLGSNDGMSNPGLPTLLKAAGWGPIRMTTTLGMRVRNNSNQSASAYHVLSRWKTAGFNPSVIAVNVGGNHIGDCAPSTVSRCKALVDELLTQIAALFPSATVWWAKTLHETYGKGTGFSPGMLGWNAALDQAAAQHPRLVVWDWPAAVSTAQPPIVLDDYSVHPVSGAEYVKRSNLIVADLGLRMPAHYSGPRATLPAAGPRLLEYTPSTVPTRVYSTIPSDVPQLTAGVVTHLDLSAEPGIPADAEAGAFTLTVSGAASSGSVRVSPCGSSTPVSSIRFAQDQRVSAQVIVRFAPLRHVCIVTTKNVDVELWSQGTFAPDSPTGQRLTPMATPTRTVTAVTTMPAGGAIDVSLPLPFTAEAVALNVTVINPTGKGNLTLHRCDQAPTLAMHVAFGAGATTSAAAFAPTSAPTSRRVCARIRMAAGTSFAIESDVTGLFRTNDTGARFRPALVAQRLLDTSPATRTGGWYGRQIAGQRLDLPAAPAGAVAVSGNVVANDGFTAGRLAAASCAISEPATTAVSAAPGGRPTGGITSAVDARGRLCIWSTTNTNTAFDIAGWWEIAP